MKEYNIARILFTESVFGSGENKSFTSLVRLAPTRWRRYKELRVDRFRLKKYAAIITDICAERRKCHLTSTFR